MGARESQSEGDAILFWNGAAFAAHRRDFTKPYRDSAVDALLPTLGLGH